LKPSVDPRFVIEALLYTARAPLSESVLAEALSSYGGADCLSESLRLLGEDYQGGGVVLHRCSRGWSLRTLFEASDLARAFAPEPLKLTRAALETLVTIAVFQPITRPEIERVRGVSLSPGILDVLLAAELVRPGRRRDTPGRPLTWQTTDAFLDFYGIESLDEIPAYERAKSAGQLVLPPARSNGDGPEDSGGPS